MWAPGWARRRGECEEVDCWVCERTALGACRFCGRGTCREHAKTQPFVFDVFRGNKHQMLRALVVEDALHCGVCRPRGDPVDLPELECTGGGGGHDTEER